MARTLIVLIAFVSLLVPATGYAASGPTLDTRVIEDRTLVLYYKDIPKDSLFTLYTGPRYETAEKVVREDVRLRGTRGQKRIQLPKGSSGYYHFELYTKDGAEVGSAGRLIELPKPTCKMTLSEKRAMRGDNVTLRWSSDNAERATIFGSMKAKAHGAERIALYQPGVRVFNGAFYGAGGVAVCNAKITVGE